MADDCVSIHCEGVEHHGRVDEVLLHALQAGVQLLKPHHLGSTCKHRQEGGTAVELWALHTLLLLQGRTGVLSKGSWWEGRAQDVGVRSSGPLEFLSSWGVLIFGKSNEGDEAQAGCVGGSG